LYSTVVYTTVLTARGVPKDRDKKKISKIKMITAKNNRPLNKSAAGWSLRRKEYNPKKRREYGGEEVRGNEFEGTDRGEKF